MNDKRYQVFISSTFEDLREERRAVQDVVINNLGFPVQMESFPAADVEQFEFIKKLIDQCDYYVLIIAGRYGSLDQDGLSYTHKEYRYAVSQKIPVLVMIHGAKASIAAGKSEETPEGRLKLEEFIKETKTNRLCKLWETIGDLKLAVREALDNAKVTQPRVGWVRGDNLASIDALAELNHLRKELEKYKETIGELAAEIDVSLPEIPALTETISIELLSNTTGWGTGSCAKIKTDWKSLFPIFHNSLVWEQATWDDYRYIVDQSATCIKLGSNIAGLLATIDPKQRFKVSEETYASLEAYYIEAGFMNSEGADTPFTEFAKKFSRRLRISGVTSNGFEVTSGEIAIVAQAPNLDDEIPF